MTHQPLTKPPVHFSKLKPFDQVIYIAGVGLGSGLSPKMPGTAASFVILILVPLWASIGFWPSLLVIAVMSMIGIPICGRTATIMQVHDDSRIVWDEFAGQSIALLPLIYLLQLTTLNVVAAFILFRIFDIVKPWPIGWLDQHVSGGLGIMVDDILAGLMAALSWWLGFIVLGHYF